MAAAGHARHDASPKQAAHKHSFGGFASQEPLRNHGVAAREGRDGLMPPGEPHDMA
jgi:hypothetical protein